MQWFFGILCPLVALFSAASLIPKRSWSFSTFTDTLISTLRLNYSQDTWTVLVAIYHILLLLSGAYLGALIATDVQHPLNHLSQLSGVSLCTSSPLLYASLSSNLFIQPGQARNMPTCEGHPIIVELPYSLLYSQPTLDLSAYSVSVLSGNDVPSYQLIVPRSSVLVDERKVLFQ